MNNWLRQLFELYEKELDCTIDDFVGKEEYKILLAPFCAFLIYSYLADGTIVINAVATVEKGVASQLLQYLINKNSEGVFMAATLNADQFYMKNGFIWCGEVFNKQGKKLNVYRR